MPLFTLALIYVTSDIVTLLYLFEEIQSKENVMKLNIVKSRDFLVYNLSFHLMQYLFFFFLEFKYAFRIFACIDFHRIIMII